MIGLLLNYLWLQGQSGYSDTFTMSRGCHCKRGDLYTLGTNQQCPYWEGDGGKSTQKEGQTGEIASILY